jgi:peptidoglycan/xylan/chitin deacetylase (PgdA/CDA1 family)
VNITRRGFLKLGSATLLLLALPEGSTAAVSHIPVLMYHDIGIAPNEKETVAPAQFAAQMEWLYAGGYRAVSIAELGAQYALNAGNIVLITVDDGHVSFLDYAFYLLREYGFKATVNVIGGYVGGFVNENHPRLSWDECRYLMQSGLVEIGCHTYNLHDRDVHSSPDAALAEFNNKLEEDLNRFQRVYAQELGKKADILAWPYGAFNLRSIEIAKKAGFKYLLNSDVRPVKYERDLVDIPRLAVNNSTNLVKFRGFFKSSP